MHFVKPFNKRVSVLTNDSRYSSYNKMCIQTLNIALCATTSCVCLDNLRKNVHPLKMCAMGENRRYTLL